MQAKNYSNNIQVKRDCFDGTVAGIAGNVLALGAVADFGVQNCQYTTKVDAG